MDPPVSPPAFEFRVPAPVTPRLKRRSIHTPYPQHSIPPSPASSSSSPFTNPLSSPTSPMKPTSSLARRRRSLIVASPPTGVAGAASLLQRIVTDPSPAHNHRYPIVSSPPSTTSTTTSTTTTTTTTTTNTTTNTTTPTEIMASAVHDEDEIMSQAAAIVCEPDHATTDLDSIAQAMMLLSLHPTITTETQAHWPDPEELLKESLRQSLAALRALREAKSIIKNIDCRRASESEGSEPCAGAAPERNVFEVEELFKKVVGDLKGAKEAIGWAEQQMEVEGGLLRERLLKR